MFPKLDSCLIFSTFTSFLRLETIGPKPVRNMKAAFTKIYVSWENLDVCESGPDASPICAENTRSIDVMPFRADDMRAYIAQISASMTAILGVRQPG